VRLHRDLKIVASGLTRFVNVAVQIDDAICEVKLTVLAFSFLRACRAQSDCRELNVIMVKRGAGCPRLTEKSVATVY
jgi:hypothetical protein